MSAIFSPGKLLLTSEYFVLDGALALAVPTKTGQYFDSRIIEDGLGRVIWKAYHQDQIWLELAIDYKSWEILYSNIENAGNFILKVLQNVQQLSEKVFCNTSSYHITTNLEFPADYGWGSSSTLMNNMGQWAEIDPFRLNEMSLGGSGYDIAVAKYKCPLLFQNLAGDQKSVLKINFDPDFTKDLILIHLNTKQNSREGIALYKQKTKSDSLIEEFSEITRKIAITKSLEEFSSQMQHHEDLVSQFLGIETVKKKYFSDCPVFLKSLGAWGGDFILSAHFDDCQKYFSEKGFKTVLEWRNIIG